MGYNEICWPIIVDGINFLIMHLIAFRNKDLKVKDKRDSHVFANLGVWVYA